MMYRVKFKYADALSGWEWRSQECTLFAANKTDAVIKCVRLYGLDVDCKYKIVSIEEEDKQC